MPDPSYYNVIVLDRDGFTIADRHDVEGLKTAKQDARDLLSEHDDAEKAEVRDDVGECVWDVFA